MNRRNLLKGIFSLVALFPFMSLIKKKQNEAVIFGIDEAKPGEDQTILVFDEPLSDQDYWLKYKQRWLYHIARKYDFECPYEKYRKKGDYFERL